MKKSLSFFKAAQSKALEVRADFRLGFELPMATEGKEVFVRAEFLNLASSKPLSKDYMQSLSDFCLALNAKKVHASFANFEHNNVYFFEPIPVVLSPSLLEPAIAKSNQIQDQLGLPLAIRNYFDPQADLAAYIPVVDFFYELSTRANTEVICDVASTVAFAKTFGEDEVRDLKQMTKLNKCSAFIRTHEEKALLKDCDFHGLMLGFDESLGIDILCEGEFLE